MDIARATAKESASYSSRGQLYGYSPGGSYTDISHDSFTRNLSSNFFLFYQSSFQNSGNISWTATNDVSRTRCYKNEKNKCKQKNLLNVNDNLNISIDVCQRQPNSTKRNTRDNKCPRPKCVGSDYGISVIRDH